MTDSSNLFRPSDYFRPETVGEVIDLLAQHGRKARVLAGGTDLMTEKDPAIDVLVDISRLGLNHVTLNGNGPAIGPAITFAELAASTILADDPYNVLTEAARHMGTPQIRNIATIGGNICSAVPSADSAPPLLVLDAVLNISGSNGERFMDIDEFFLDARKTALDIDEIVTEIRLPKLPSRTAATFIKKGRVAVADLALVSTAVSLTLAEDDTCRNVRIALGSVAPTPIRAKEAEVMLEGKRADDKLLEKVANQASKEINPITDFRASAESRTILSCVVVEEALKRTISKIAAF
jgi:carbon-monoxide dehydrogenase medium subunit